MLKEAIACHQAGRYADAEKLYGEILSASPGHSDALHLTGLIRLRQGESEQAIMLIEKAICINPDASLYYASMGDALQAQGKIEDALAAYRKALEIDPENAGIYCSMGAARQSRGQKREAAACYEKALAFDPGHADAMYNLGVLHHEEGDLNGAVRWYEGAVGLHPGHGSALTNLGAAYQAMGSVEKAALCYEQAMAADASNPDTYHNLGTLFHQQGMFQDAVICFKKSIGFRPAHAATHYNLGNALKALGNLPAAVMSYRDAVRLQPAYPDALNNLGSALQDLGRLEEAIDCYRHAIDIRPDDTGARTNLGTAYEENQQFQKALACYERVLALDGNDADVCGRLVHLLHHRCDWERLDTLKKQLTVLNEAALAKGMRPPETPFMSFTMHPDPKRNLAVCRAWSAYAKQHSTGGAAAFDRYPGRSGNKRITVGYLSNSFRNHPGAHLILGLFGVHDREKYKINCYSYGVDDGSEYRNRIVRECDDFIDIAAIGNADAAERIFHDGVDILVDLRGHTHKNRIGICALRPAPVQVSFLGFPCTTGADYMDYMIADKVVAPPSHEQFYTERLVYMPHCYQVNDSTQKISEREWTRQALGLPDDGIVFASFNTSYKIEPAQYACWMRILENVPGSVLWLLCGNQAMMDNLRRETERGGVDPSRVVFAEKMRKDEHLARLKKADLVLDTFPCNGHTSTSDALWAGVPVLTMLGSHFASRVSASILNSVGSPELVTRSDDAYEEMAVRFGLQPDLLLAVRNKLSKNRSHAPLFDTVRYTRNLECAYREMWAIYQAGERPRRIEVQDIREAGASGGRQENRTTSSV